MKLNQAKNFFQSGTSPSGHDGGGRGRSRQQRTRFSRFLAVFAQLTLLGLLILSVAAGCSGSSSGTPYGAGISGARVDMIDTEFDPVTITIKVGESVTWVNQDPVSHDAVAGDGSWKTDILGEGDSATITFNTPGTYPYICTLHAGMKGTVIGR